LLSTSFAFSNLQKKIDLLNLTFFNKEKLEADKDEFVIRGAAWGCQPQLHPSTQAAPHDYTYRPIGFSEPWLPSTTLRRSLTSRACKL
jgi:hypothetical protein